MSSYEYHKFLKFLYFEGYANSYEEAEYLLEEINDDEFQYLIDEYEYLIERPVGREEMIAANIARARREPSGTKPPATTSSAPSSSSSTSSAPSSSTGSSSTSSAPSSSSSTSSRYARTPREYGRPQSSQNRSISPFIFNFKTKETKEINKGWKRRPESRRPERPERPESERPERPERMPRGPKGNRRDGRPGRKDGRGNRNVNWPFSSDGPLGSLRS